MVRERKGRGRGGGGTKVGGGRFTGTINPMMERFRCLLDPRELKTYEYAGDVGLNELSGKI